MEIKRYYDPVALDGTVLDRNELLGSPQAAGIEAEIQISRKRKNSRNNAAVNASEIFAVMKKRGVIKQLIPRKKVRFTRPPLNGLQKISSNVIDGGLTEGWLSVDDKNITMHTLNGDVVFKKLRKPGRYCVHDGEYIGTNKGDGAEARNYIKSRFSETPSPDVNWPHGYEVLNAFECEYLGEYNNG